MADKACSTRRHNHLPIRRTCCHDRQSHYHGSTLGRGEKVAPVDPAPIAHHQVAQLEPVEGARSFMPARPLARLSGQKYNQPDSCPNCNHAPMPGKPDVQRPAANRPRIGLPSGFGTSAQGEVLKTPKVKKLK
ncbi:MAG: hypothetical protein IPN48_05105 [Sphingomonadales bacterium]|nr:hypothetical protein [Sphingomonadales bacterium]